MSGVVTCRSTAMDITPRGATAPPAVHAFLSSDGSPIPYDGASPVTWRLGAYVLVVRNGRVLMVEPTHTARWELPGGGVNVRELLAEGAARECYEETGYRFVACGFSPFYLGEGFVCWDSARGVNHVIAAVFQGTVDGEVEVTWKPDPTEIRQVSWIDPADLNTDNTHPNFWPVLRYAELVG